MTTIQKRYPASGILPQGAYYLLQGEVPTMKLRSWDDTMVFNLEGGENIPDYYSAAENVYVKEIKGLIPPWKQIDQKGATEDGRSFITSLYDPAEVELTLVVKGKTPQGVQRTRDDLIAAVDAIQTSELSWFTHRLGRWWAPVRFMSSPMDPEGGVRTLKQVVSMRLRAYDSFWRSYDSVDLFRIPHADVVEDFSTVYSSGLGTGWTVALSGAGSGGVSSDGTQCRTTLANGHTAVIRRVGFSETHPVVELTIGSLGAFTWDATTTLDFWWDSGSGTPGTTGIRARLLNNAVELHSFSGGVGTLIGYQALAFPPKSGEPWTFVTGQTIKVFRQGALVFSQNLGTDHGYTAAGFGMSSSSTVLAPGVRYVSLGSDTASSASGFVKLTNWGDQPMPPRFTVVGPGTFAFADGPGSGEYVEFGPILEGQTAQIITDARKRGVVDLSYTPANPTENNIFNEGVADLKAFTNLLGGLINSLTGIFGQSSTPLAPQGNLYRLLQGRFSKASYLPPKPTGGPPSAQYISVGISGGNSSSQILAAGTPLRRLPY